MLQVHWMLLEAFGGRGDATELFGTIKAKAEGLEIISLPDS